MAPPPPRKGRPMNDRELQYAVLWELEWEPLVQSTDMGVATKDGVVTLSGYVSSYHEKLAAERAVKRVAGVRAVADDLKVKSIAGQEPTDTEIARAAVQGLEAIAVVPADRVQVTVRHGWVTLEGEVAHHYQKEAADSGVRYLAGIHGVTNEIAVAPEVSPDEGKPPIEEPRLHSVDLVGV